MTILFSLLGFTPALCHSNPCKENGSQNFQKQLAPVKIVGELLLTRCVTRLLNCALQNTNSTDLDPHCDYHGISVMPNNCDITYRCE